MRVSSQNSTRIYCARWGGRDAKQFFGGQRKAMFLIHGADVIKAIEIRQCLHVCFRFDQFFGAAMKQPDMRIGTRDHFAVHFHDEA